MAGKYPPRNVITKTKLILCEGPSDEAFFRAVLKANHLPECSIRNTSEADNSGRGGIDKFGKLLVGIKIWAGFPEVTDILIVADNDLTPKDNFSKVKKQIGDAGGYDIPNEPIDRVGTTPYVIMLMIPWTNKKGNLESFCLDAAMESNKVLSAHVDHFAEQSGASKWKEITLLGKMKLRSLIAARHKPDPFVGLGNIWNEDQTIIPLDHVSFKKVIWVLKTFTS